jgi:hypothetical protein
VLVMALPGLGVLTSGSQRLYSWWTAKSTRDQLLENLDEASLYEQWEASAYQLDEVSGLDLWYTPTTKWCIALLTKQ